MPIRTRPIWHYWDRRNWLTLRRTPVDGIGRPWQTVSMADSESLTGRRETRRDAIIAAPLVRLAAMLDHPGLPWRSGEVPPLAIGNKPLDFVAALVEADFQASNIFRATREVGCLEGHSPPTTVTGAVKA